MDVGLLFDIDGTLVDTDDLHFAAFASVFAQHGVSLDKRAFEQRIIGSPVPKIAADFLPWMTEAEAAAVVARKEAEFRARLGDVTTMRGVGALLDFADSHCVTCAVVTNAPRQNAVLILTKLGISQRFKTVVIADELAEAKPHPLPYLTGLERLNAKADVSVAFEDSRSGITAAVAAGLNVVGIMTSLDAATILDLGAVMAARDFTDARIFEMIGDFLAAEQRISNSE